MTWTRSLPGLARGARTLPALGGFAVLLALPALCAAAAAADGPSTGAWGQEPRHRFRLGAQATFRIQLELRETGAALTHRAGPSSGSGIGRSYDDGFVGVDSSGNAGGATWNWGYRSEAQVVGNGTGLAFSAVEGSPYGGGRTVGSDPQCGGEVGYSYRVDPLGRGGAWGIDAALGWTPLGMGGGLDALGTLQRTVDVYGLEGVVPPVAPYVGSAQGPGPLLSDAPIRSTVPVSTRVTGRQDLDADLLVFTLGPSIEFPLGSDRLVGRLSAGLALGHVDGRFAYSESASLSDGRTWVRGGAVDGSEWVLGGYVRSEVLWRWTEAWSLRVAAGFTGMESPVFRVPGRDARLGLGGALQLTAGVAFGY